MSESTEVVAGRYSVFNAERGRRYGLLIATGIRSRLDDIISYIEAVEEEEEPRSTGPKQRTAPRKQKAGRQDRK